MIDVEVIPTVVPHSAVDVDVFVSRDRSFSRTFHIDIADGIFAPNVTWMPGQGEELQGADEFFFETHLMAAHPETVGTAFIAAGARRVIAHAEAFESEREGRSAFDAWRKSGAQQIGVAILIETPLEALEPYVLHIDCVTVMSIPRIGVQGIPFDERGYGRVADIHARYPDMLLEVDGGVDKDRIAALARAGARRFSVGSAIAKSVDPARTHSELLQLAQAAV